MIEVLRNLFAAKSGGELQTDEELAAEAAAVVVVSILTQLTMVALRNVTDDPVSLKSRAGSETSIAYMFGFSKGVHEHFENTAEQYINDGNMKLAALGSIFRGNSMDECLTAYQSTMEALESSAHGTHAAFALGKNDYLATLNGDSDVSGLVSILGVGTIS